MRMFTCNCILLYGRVCVQLRYKYTVFPVCAIRVSIQKDTKVPNAAIFTVNKEDHTLGNLLMQ